MKVRVVIAAVATVLALAGCAGASTAPAPGSGGPAASAQPSSAVGTSAPGSTSAQFGGDVCSALTRADVEGATYPQGAAVFASTDTQKDATASLPVVCQYLVTFGGKPSVVGAFVALLSADELRHRQQVSLIQTPEAISGVGTEASVVMAAPGLYEVWVTGPHGKFTVGAQDRATAIALATVAVGRN